MSIYSSPLASHSTGASILASSSEFLSSPPRLRTPSTSTSSQLVDSDGDCLITGVAPIFGPQASPSMPRRSFPSPLTTPPPSEYTDFPYTRFSGYTIHSPPKRRQTRTAWWGKYGLKMRYRGKPRWLCRVCIKKRNYQQASFAYEGSDNILRHLHSHGYKVGSSQQLVTPLP